MEKPSDIKREEEEDEIGRLSGSVGRPRSFQGMRKGDGGKRDQVEFVGEARKRKK